MVECNKSSRRSWIDSNQNLKCEACERSRVWTSRWCITHAGIVAQYGQPTRIPFRFTMIKPQIAEVTELFAKNMDHPGLVHYREYFERHAEVAGNGGQGFEGWKMFRLIHQLEGDISKMTIKTCALYRFYDKDGDNHRRMIPTERSLFTLLGRAVRSCCRNHTAFRPRLTYFDVRKTGQQIWKHFGSFLLQTSHAVDKMHEAKNKYHDDLNTPFNL